MYLVNLRNGPYHVFIAMIVDTEGYFKLRNFLFFCKQTFY
jgi:hypothetical protein